MRMRLLALSLLQLLSPLCVYCSDETVIGYELKPLLKKAERHARLTPSSFNLTSIRLIADLEQALKPGTVLTDDFSIDVSEECFNETTFLIQNINSVWALQLFDSWGKLQSGLFQGNLKWWGDFDACLNISVPSRGGLDSDFLTRYCAVNIPASIFGTATIGLCVPKGCGTADVTKIVTPAVEKLNMKVKTVSCKALPSEKTFPAGAIVAAVVLSTIAVLCIVATVVDGVGSIIFTCRPSVAKSDDDAPLIDPSGTTASVEKTKSCSGSLKELLLMFSLYSNSRKILDTRQPTGAIESINGIRFLSMSWVLLGHTLLFYSLGRVKNIVYLGDLMKRWSFQVMLNATVSVDSFFVMSGLLAGYLLIKDLNRRQSGLKDFLKSLPLIYLQRYLRLTPVYGAMIIVYACFLYYIGNGPNWPEYPERSFDPHCTDSWYLNLLYVNNLFNIEKGGCAGWGWYLANDFQFFLVAPFVIYLYFRHEVVGLVLATLMVLGSNGAAFGASHLQRISLSVLPGAKTNFKPLATPARFPEYFVPWSRYQSYGVGIIAGLILWKLKQKRVRIHPVVNALLWGVSAALCLAVIYGPYNGDIGGHTITLVESDFYNAFSRTSWSLGLSFVIISCHLGQGGWVNEFLSWKAFVPLSRLTYCAYLIHLPILLFSVAYARDAAFYTDLNLAEDFLFILTVTMFMAFPFSLFYEIPFTNMLKAYLSPLSIKQGRVNTKSDKSNKENGTVKQQA